MPHTGKKGAKWLTHVMSRWPKRKKRRMKKKSSDQICTKIWIQIIFACHHDSCKRHKLKKKNSGHFIRVVIRVKNGFKVSQLLIILAKLFVWFIIKHPPGRFFFLIDAYAWSSISFYAVCQVQILPKVVHCTKDGSVDLHPCMPWVMSQTKVKWSDFWILE